MEQYRAAWKDQLDRVVHQRGSITMGWTGSVDKLEALLPALAER